MVFKCLNSHFRLEIVEKIPYEIPQKEEKKCRQCPHKTVSISEKFKN